MANRRMLETIMDLYMRQKAQKESQARANEYELGQQEQQYRLAGENQREAAKLRAEEALWGEAVKNPRIARQLRAQGVAQLAGKPLDGLGVEERSAAPELDQITKADSPGKLAGLGALGNQYVQGKRDAQSPIKDLNELGMITAAHGNQEATLKRNTAPVKISYPDQKGNMMDEYKNPWDIQDQPFLNAPTAEQAGTKKGEEFLAEDKVSGKARTSRAAATAGAEAGARTAAEIKTKEANLPVLTKIEEAIAKARATGKPSPNASPIIGKFASDIVRLAGALNQSESVTDARLSGQRNALGDMGIPFVGDSSPLLDERGQPVRNVKGVQMTRLEGYHELEVLRKGMTSTLLRALGRMGPSTEGDEKRTAGLIPGGNLSKTESQNAIVHFQRLAQAAQMVGDQNPPIETFPPEQQEAEVARRIEEAQRLASQGGIDPEAEAALGVLNAR